MLSRGAMKTFEKIFRCADMSIATKIRMVQSMVFLLAIWKNKLDTEEER